MFEVGVSYTRDEIHARVGGSVQSYLPHVGGKVVAACLRLDTNPNAPEVILVGSGEGIEHAAELLVAQPTPLPIFLKRDPGEWEYVGDYFVERASTNAADLGAESLRSERTDLTRIVYMVQRRPTPCHYLNYWKPKTVELHRQEGGLWRHAASEQFSRLALGDTAWLVSVQEGRLRLVTRIVVGRITDQRGAAKLLGCKPSDLWDSSHHIIAMAGSEVGFLDVDIHHLASSLRFERARHDRLTLDAGAVSAQQLQTMRVLSPASARLLAPASGELRPGEGGDAVAECEVPFVMMAGDSREAVLRQIKARRGQQAFRDALRRRYGTRCMISGCPLLDILEAAHIKPYRGGGDHHPANGLLLRADLHTLFDLNLIGIEPVTLTVHVHEEAKLAGYGEYDGVILKCGQDEPSDDALTLRWESFRRQG
jgi:hypothetical protein